MGRIDPDPSASDDQVVTDRKNDFVHGLLTMRCGGITMNPSGVTNFFDREPLVAVVRHIVGIESKKADVSCVTSPSRLIAGVLKSCSHPTEL
jgi:hypothetical protein